MLNLNLERYGRFLLNGVELDRLQLGTGEAVKAVPTATEKASAIQLKPTRVVRNLFDKTQPAQDYGTDVKVYTINVPNGTYTCSTDIPLHNGYPDVWFEENPISLNSPSTITVTGGVTHISMRSSKYLDVLNGNNWIMLVAGSTAQPFYPHFSPQTVLPSLKAYGATPVKHKQDKIWSRFVPCDGITNGSSTSIDTGVKAQDNIEMFVRFKAVTDSFYILQARETGSAKIYGLSGSQTGNTITSFGLTSAIHRTTGHICTIKMTMVNRAVTLYVKDETTGEEDTKTGTAAASDYPFPSPTTIKLFGDASKVGSGVTVYRAYIKINGAMAWDMYPAVDVTDSNKTVAYDDVTHAASEKLSGSFTGGSLIQPIAYAESDGTAYVDTGIIPTVAKETDILLKISANAVEANGFGANRNLNIETQSSSTVWRVNGATTTAPRVANEIIDVELKQTSSGRYYKIKSVEGYGSNNDDTFSFYLGKLNGSTSTNGFKGKYYSAVIKENGTLVRDYIPVRVGTTVELLDLVSWSFAPRTGTFTAGADIPYAQLQPDIIKVNTGDLIPLVTPSDTTLYPMVLNGWKKHTFDGTETWGTRIWAGTGGSGQLDNCTDTHLSGIGGTSGDRRVYSPNFTTSLSLPSAALRLGGVFIGSPTQASTVSIGFGISTTDYPTLESWVSHLQSVGETVLYPLATSDGSEWKPTILDGAYGYICTVQGTGNSPAGTFVKAEGMTGSVTGVMTLGSHKIFVGCQGVVDLGTLNWSDRLGNGLWVTVGTFDPTYPAKAFGTTNIYSPNYVTSVGGAEGTIYGADANQLIYIKDSRYTTVAEFIAAMSGKYLFYQRTDDTEFIPPIIRDVPMLLSADSFVDTQVDSNNKSEAWGVKVLTGAPTEGWTMHATLSGLFFHSLAAEGALVQPTSDNYGEATCAEAVRKTAGSINMGECCFQALNAGSTARFCLRLPFDSVNELKAYLAEKPAIIAFPLTTPALSTHAIAPVELTEKATYTAASEAELPVTEQGTYLGVGV